MNSILLLVIVVVVAVAILAVLKAKSQGSIGDEVWPFYAKKPLSQPEQVLYFRLVQALPDHIVLAQVQLSRLLGVKKGNNYQAWFNRINRMSADFVVCKKDSSIVAVIELDDATHQKEDRQVADAKKDKALASAAENLLGSAEIAGKSGFIAGGKAQGCQMRTRDLVATVFYPIGLPMPDESLFSPELNSYYLDWYDTEETQALLGYQRHSMAQWQAILMKRIRYLRPFIPLFQAGIMQWLEKRSPRYPH